MVDRLINERSLRLCVSIECGIPMEPCTAQVIPRSIALTVAVT